MLGLPLIKNVKTVDPADSSSPEVIQIESAMGAAIEVFEGATAIGVGRERFLPVKTTNDLLLLRSDVYEVGDDGRLTRPRPIRAAGRPRPDVLQDHRRLRGAVPGRRAVAAAGQPPDGAGATGPSRPVCVVEGEVTLADAGEPRTVPAQTVLTTSSSVRVATAEVPGRPFVPAA